MTHRLTDKLQRFVDATDSARDDLSDTLDTADAYLTAGVPGIDTVAQPIRDDATIAVAADLWGQRDARNGVMAIDSTDGLQPYRVSTDPLRAAWPKLRAAGIPAGLGIA